MFKIALATVIGLLALVGGASYTSQNLGAVREFTSAQLASGADNNECLKTDGTFNSWGVCGSAGGGGGGGAFSTTTSTHSGRLIVYPNNDTDILTVGANATTSAEFYFDPNTTTYRFTGNGTTTGVFNAGVNVTAPFFNATGTKASIFPYASTTALTVSGSAYIGSLTGVLKATSGLISTGVDGTDFTLINASTCSNQFLRAVTAAGVFTCETVANADLANSTISGIALGSNLANLTATDSTLTFSGTYNGSTARTIGLNLGNANAWTALQSFTNANSILATGSTTLQNFTGRNATTTNATTTTLTASSSLCLGSDCRSSWPSSSAVGGSDTQVQFNDGGSALGGDAGFVYNKTADRATVTYASSTGVTVSSHLNIPNGAAPATVGAGTIGWDTSDNQLIVNDLVVARGTQKIWSVTVSSTSPAFIAGANLPVPTDLDGYVITAIRCIVSGGTSKALQVTDGTNATESITCATTVTSDDGSITNGTVTAAEPMFIDFGATSGAVNYVSVSVFGTITRE